MSNLNCNFNCTTNASVDSVKAGFNTGGFITTSSSYNYTGSSCFDSPFNTIEKDNCKILQYELIGLNKSHITVKKNFVNKTKTLTLKVEGKFEDEVTGWKNDININLNVDYNIYNKVSWKIKDGILTITLFEILNDEPEFVLSEE